MRSRMGELRFRIGSFQQGLSWRTDIGLRFPQMRKTGSTAPGPVRRKRSCADSFPHLARWFASLVLRCVRYAGKRLLPQR